MSHQKTYRPRLARSTRDRALQAAEQLNGEEVSTFPEALELLLSYHDVLNGSVACHLCGEEPIDSVTQGKWRCWDCGEISTVYDVLGSDDMDNTDIPVVPRQ